MSTQNLFNSYNQLRANAALIQKNVEVMEAALRATETQASIGMATQADVLKAQKNLQSIQSTQTETLASLETLRQNLCMMTGWSYDAQPEIREVPHANGDAIAQINLEADTQTALANNYDLQYSRRALGNMQENSTDRKNQERTVKNLEQTVSATMTNLYNDIRQKQIAWQLAQAELATEEQTMSAMETKRSLGMASDIEYLQEHGVRDISIIEGSWVGDSTGRAFRTAGYDAVGRKYNVPLYASRGTKPAGWTPPCGPWTSAAGPWTRGTSSTCRCSRATARPA